MSSTLSPNESFNKFSFDRFGDDLTELILSYLSFEDKFRFECVAKQWRRLVFNKQLVLRIDTSFNAQKNPKFNRLRNKFVSNSIDKSLVGFVIRKCPHIKRVILDVNHEGLLELIGDRCPHLTQLRFNYEFYFFYNKSFIDFGLRYGHRLQVLEFSRLFYNITEFLKCCPNLKRTNAELKTKLILEDKDFLPKLETIEDLVIEIESLTTMKSLTEKYWKTMKKIRLSLSGLSRTELKTCLLLISQFESIQSLELTIGRTIGSKEFIDESVKLMVKRLTKLKSFLIKVTDNSLISDRFFTPLSELKSIERLVIQLNANKQIYESVECFKKCPKLKHLEIIYK